MTDEPMRTGTSERPDLPLAVVIGAGGMGLSIARRLGQSCRVVIASLVPAENEAAEKSLRADGIDVNTIVCDLRDAASVAAMAAFVGARGPLRRLAHVAALSPTMGDWRSILTVNLIGAARVEQALLPVAEAGTAAVFISSLAAHGSPGPASDLLAVLDRPLAPDFIERVEALVSQQNPGYAYSLAKIGLNRMCRRRAGAWGKRGARIVSVSPGLIATPMGAKEFSGPSRDVKLKMLRQSPIRREGTMVEISDAVEFLTSDRASFITGTDLLVDGGAAAAMLFPEEDQIPR